ncbi:type III pantothenate kinase [Aeromicrobium sp. 636]|uniref:Type III pantothenate kinase n=1 Tax=Aeromicrobium senzhongii TaxID=2663859 RepID=A0A8I0EW36_9ACTN|nr:MULTISPECIES: type III pantothenate kinase [Aeromicrobium]MBC9227279.1 type III pantothenate kinase [Aeromicrobium senzhongii]MCQ3999377.1 type III pantothenate kinase [Aeromicrobium sp. 636]MTB88311.1 type III pantothenate kinase [Aeromicrobium senzhongii]QNL94713.1 type III pantothenate kinase [Aeromicrobium senzhongii]
MTLLAIDAGNAETSIGLFDGDELAADFVVASDERRTSDEWFLVVDGFVRRAGLPEVDEIAMCCTVPALLVALRKAYRRYYADVPAWVVGPGVKTGVPIHTDNPREVGTDRVVNALAAKELYGGPAIVVDLTGTATVVDAIDAEGRYLGGAIAPGVEVSLEALARRSAQLRSVEISTPRDVIGKNTVEALQSGTVFGFAGLIDAIVERMIDSLGEDPEHVSVIATGSHAAVVLSECETITARNPKLTLEGLRLVAARNR